MFGGRQRKGHKGKVKSFDSPKARLKKDGKSDPEDSLTEAPSYPTRHLETWNRRLLP